MKIPRKLIFNHDGYAKSQKKDDIWAQIKRTVKGKPVKIQNITSIEKKIFNSLKINYDDFLLDLGCGNGAITFRLKKNLKKIYAVDSSKFLIEIAKNKFKSNKIKYFCDDLVHFTNKFNSKINKVLIYGVISYLNDIQLKKLFINLEKNFPKLSHIFIGNAPDLSKIKLFYYKKIPKKNISRSSKTVIGKWRKKEEFNKILGKKWLLTFSTMPKNFYSSHYRYDILIKKK